MATMSHDQTSVEGFEIRDACITRVGPPRSNLYLEMVDSGICFELQAKKTWRNRLKYWLFCQFFPFQVKRWDK